jgi:DNA-binding LytR/AlgR family response regulator
MQMANIHIYKSKLLKRQRTEFAIIETTGIALLLTENGLVYGVDAAGKRHLIECTNLKELFNDLDPERFYRANRKFVINIDYLIGFKVIGKSHMELKLKIPHAMEIYLSQERSSEFKKWIGAL